MFLDYKSGVNVFICSQRHSTILLISFCTPGVVGKIRTFESGDRVKSCVIAALNWFNLHPIFALPRLSLREYFGVLSLNFGGSYGFS